MKNKNYLIRIFFLIYLLSFYSSIFSDEINNSFFNFIELYSNPSINIPKTVYKEKNFLLSTASLIFGSTIDFNFLNLRYYQKTKNTSFNEISTFNNFNDFQTSLQKPAWSFMIDIKRIPITNFDKFTLKLYGGTLSYSESASRLRNLTFSNSQNPLSNSCTFNNAIGITLASKSASNKQTSFAASYQNKNICIQGAYFTDNQVLACVSYKKNFSGFAKINTLLTYSRFDIYSKLNDSWFMTFPTFTNDKKNALYLETLFSIPLLQTKISSGIIENPYNQIRYFFSAENYFHYNNYSLGLGFFANDSYFNNYKLPIITTSSQLSKTICQFKVNPQFEYKSENNFSFKAGICGIYEHSILQENFNDLHRTNINIGTDFILKNNKISLLYKMQDFVAENSKHTAYIKYYFYGKKLNFYTFIKADYFPFQNLYKSEKNQTIGFSINYKNFPIKYFSLYSTFTEKEKNVTPSINCTISTDFSIRKIKLTGKIQLKTSLLVE